MTTTVSPQTGHILNQVFFEQNTITVARRLLGTKLVRQVGQKQVSGIIVETEAYCGQDDSACHAFRAKTPRNEVMFGPAGFSYIYLIYGLHHMLNVVTEAPGNPCAVLFRALEPLTGQDFMQQQRQRNGTDLTNGPGKLCQALALSREHNIHDLTKGETLWLESYVDFASEAISAGPRVGIGYASPEDQQKPWRFWITDNPFVSKG